MNRKQIAIFALLACCAGVAVAQQQPAAPPTEMQLTLRATQQLLAEANERVTAFKARSEALDQQLQTLQVECKKPDAKPTK